MSDNVPADRLWDEPAPKVRQALRLDVPTAEAAEAEPDALGPAWADELSTLQGSLWRPWMTPVEQPMPADEGTTGLAAWLWIVVVIGVVTLALAGLVEWLR